MSGDLGKTRKGVVWEHIAMYVPMYRFNPDAPLCTVSYIESVCQRLAIIAEDEVVGCNLDCCLTLAGKPRKSICPFDYVPEDDNDL